MVATNRKNFMRRLKILAACEASGRIVKAFRERGHDAWSCDIKPTYGEYPQYHLQQDVTPLLDEKWDCIISFPPCTDLSASGARYWPEKQRDGRQKLAIEFFMKFVKSPCKHKSIENSRGIMSGEYRLPDQIIHPWYFGDPYLKMTCLWLFGLPKLIYMEQDGLFGEKKTIVEPIAHWHSGATRGGKLKDGTRRKSKLKTAKKYKSDDRAETFSGIANAMAEQWGKYLERLYGRN